MHLEEAFHFVLIHRIALHEVYFFERWQASCIFSEGLFSDFLKPHHSHLFQLRAFFYELYNAFVLY